MIKYYIVQNNWWKSVDIALFTQIKTQYAIQSLEVSKWQNKLTNCWVGEGFILFTLYCPLPS